MERVAKLKLIFFGLVITSMIMMYEVFVNDFFDVAVLVVSYFMVFTAGQFYQGIYHIEEEKKNG